MAHEQRPCPRRGGDRAYPECPGPLLPPLQTPCPDCSGRGSTWAFVYERVAPNLRGREEAEVLWLSWHGTARERKAADKELAKRNGRGR